MKPPVMSGWFLFSRLTFISVATHYTDWGHW